jgi:hypothetical protein
MRIGNNSFELKRKQERQKERNKKENGKYAMVKEETM